MSAGASPSDHPIRDLSNLRTSSDFANAYIYADSSFHATSEEGATAKIFVLALLLAVCIGSCFGGVSAPAPWAGTTGSSQGPLLGALALNVTTISSLVQPSSITLGSGTSTAKDTATLAGGVVPNGTITFNVYTTTGCSGTPVFTNSVTANGDGPYTSAAFTVPGVGTYYWVASYSGDANNSASFTVCGDTSETLTVSPASPSLTTSVSPSSLTLTTPPPSATDTASLAGGFQPTGHITFTVYDDAGCTHSVATSQVNVNHGNGNYPSAAFTPSKAATFYWVAAYSGDSNNNPFTSACGASGETLTVTPTSPALTTAASPTTLVLGSSPGTATDTATLSGGYNPTGAITFTLYLNDSSCGAAHLVFTSNAISVSGNGAYTSNAFTPDTVGTYYWVAAYNGDGNNNPITTSCGASGETLTVTKSGPSLTSAVSPASITLGASPPYTAKDTATLSGGFRPTGSITFTAFRNSACSGAPAFTSTVSVSGNGAYSSSAYTIPGAGTYFWIAAYSGDSRNGGLTTHCGDAGETLTVSPAAPGITTQVSPTSIILNASTPSTATDTATLAGGFQPSGSLTFNVFNATGCAGVSVFTSSRAVTGNGAYTSAAFTIPAAGTYIFVANYSGDANNLGFRSSCSDPNEILTVRSGNAPLASFTFTPSLSAPNTTVTFNASASLATNSGGTITSYSWTFGDGSDKGPVTTAVVTHAYATWGRFTVALTVTDSYGYTNTTTGVVVVDAPPIATFDTLFPLAKVGRPFVFNGSDSHDPDGNVTSWTWTFGDGGQGSGAVVSHTYQVTGVYNVTLTVVDNNGFRGSVTKAILVVYPQAPVAVFSINPVRPVADELVTFNASLSTSSDSIIVSYTWQFGDGSVGSGAVVAHRYDRAGAYTVQLTVRDADNMSGASTSNVFVASVPAVGFTFTPGSPLINGTITFTAAGSTDTAGIVAYNWTFGDGTVGRGYEVNKSYAAAGTYNVTLNVTNAYGVSRTITKAVVVVAPGGGSGPGSGAPGLVLMTGFALDGLATLAMGAYVYVVVRRRWKPPAEPDR